MKKEFIIFLSLFLFLAIGMHFSAWISTPIAHIQALPDSPLGLYHPLYITFLFYIVIAIIRFLVRLFKRVLQKR